MISKYTALRIGKNTIIQTVGKILSIGLSFITVGLLTRYLGTAGYGNFTLVFSYTSFFGVIADFGMQLAVVKELAAKKEEERFLQGTYFWLRLVFVVVSTVLGLGTLFFFPYSMSLKLAIVLGALAVSMSGMMGYFTAIFQARIRLDLLTLTDIVAKLITVAAIILFVHYHLGFYAIVTAVILGNFISFLLGAFLVKDALHFPYSKTIAKRLLLLSIPIGITSFLSTLYFKVDTIILSLLKSSSQVGIYSLAYKMLENIMIFWGFYMASVYPLLSRLRFKSMKDYTSLLNNSTILALVTSLPVVMIIFFFAPFLITLFGGHQFAAGIPALQILIFSLPILLINNIFYNFYVIEEKNKIIFIGMAISLLVNITLNIIFIPSYGYIAASYITVISAALLMVLYVAGLRFQKK